MSEYIITTEQLNWFLERMDETVAIPAAIAHLKPIVRCRDCKYLDDSEYMRWDNSLPECYGEPPLFCDLLSFNKWRMDGDRRVAETTFAEVEPDDFCAWGERRASE